MRVLLDTHALLWWLADDAALGESARTVIADPGNELFVSAASAWEISIKRSLGKLDAPDDLQQAVRAGGFETLDIGFVHALRAGALPRHHDDPFDRMLIAQAQLEKLTVLTHDANFARYRVKTIRSD